MNPRLLPLLILALGATPASAASAPVKDACELKALEAAKKGAAGLGALDQRKVKKYFKHDEKRGYHVHAESEVCEKRVLGFVVETAKSFNGWDTLTLEKQAEHLERVNGWYKALDERAAALKDPADDLIKRGVGLGLIQDADGARLSAEQTVALLQEEYEGGSDMLARDIRSVYEEIPAKDGEAGHPGADLAPYLRVRDALADHLAEVGRNTGHLATALNGGKAVDFTLFEKMDPKLAAETKTLVGSADAVRKGFVDFVRSGKAMEGSKLCEGPCDTVAEWVKALRGDAQATAGIDAGKAAEKNGQAKGAASRSARAGAAAEEAANALFPKELEGKVTPEEHGRLVGLGWEYRPQDEKGKADPHYLREHPVEGPVVLHPSLNGNHSYCTPGENGTCFMNNPFKGDALAAPSSGARSPGAPASAGNEAKGPAAPKESKAAPAAAQDDPAATDAEREANVLTLYADSDCRDDGTGEAYRFCPWVKAAFQKLSAERGAKTRFRFLFADAGKDAEWRGLYDSLNISAPALVYREHGQIKAMRAPHFPDAATTESKMADFVAALDAKKYEPGIPGRRVRPRVAPPPPCSGGSCGQSASSCGRGGSCAQSASDDGPPPDVKYGGAFGRGRSNRVSSRGSCSPGQPCWDGAAAAPAVAAPAAPRRAAEPSSRPSGIIVEYWGRPGCPGCDDFMGSPEKKLVTIVPGAGGSPCGRIPCAKVNGGPALLGSSAIRSAIRDAAR